MKHIIALAALGLLAGCAASTDAETRADMRADGEATLAAELRDYSQTGEPTACVNLRNVRSNRSAGEEALIFEGPGRRLWVNRPPAGCPALNTGRALQIRTTSSQLCRGEIVTVFDPVSGFQYGGCGLGDFTPYERRKS